MNSKKVLAIILIVIGAAASYMMYDYKPVVIKESIRFQDNDTQEVQVEPVSEYADNVNHINFSTDKFHNSITSCILYYTTSQERQNAIELILRHTTEVLLRKYVHYLNGGNVDIDLYYKEVDDVAVQINSYNHQTPFLSEVRRIKSYQNQLDWIYSAELEENINKLISMSVKGISYDSEKQAVISKIENIKKGVLNTPLNIDEALELANNAINELSMFEDKANQFHNVLERYYTFDVGSGVYTRKPSSPVYSGRFMNVLVRSNYTNYSFYTTWGDNYIQSYLWNQ